MTGRKAVQEANRRMLDFFANQMTELRKGLMEFEERVAKSNQQLWNNQQSEKQGLDMAEEHILLMRRVLNDALGGVTRVMTIERRAEGSEETEEAQVIDWGWYGEQLHFSDDREQFMIGVVLNEEELEERREKEKVKRRHDLVLYASGRAADKDEDELRKVYDEGDLPEHLAQFLPKGDQFKWEEEMGKIAPTIVEQVLGQREAARKQQEKLDSAKEKALLKSAIFKVYAAGDEEQLDDPEQREILVAGGLPTQVQWTPRMSEMLEGCIKEVQEEIAKREAERNKENDPEEVEAAKEELLQETKKFGEDAADVIKLIEEGKEDEARAAMAKLEEQVKAKEAEADQRGAPPIPDGATVFGG